MTTTPFYHPILPLLCDTDAAQMAMPGSILITPAVLGLVEGFVQVTTLGAMPVRGLRDPVAVYEVTGASVVRSRLQAAAAFSCAGSI